MIAKNSHASFRNKNCVISLSVLNPYDYITHKGRKNVIPIWKHINFFRSPLQLTPQMYEFPKEVAVHIFSRRCPDLHLRHRYQNLISNYFNFVWVVLWWYALKMMKKCLEPQTKWRSSLEYGLSNRKSCISHKDSWQRKTATPFSRTLNNMRVQSSKWKLLK